MERTAEEFVHRLPDGRWFVGDFVGRSSDGQEVFLVETRNGRAAVDLTIDVIAGAVSGVRIYLRKSSAKRAGQRMIERVLDADE